MIIINKVMGLIGLSAKAGKIVSGMDACIEEMQRKKVDLVIVSEEASDKTKKNMLFFGEKYQIPVCEYGRIEDLSKAIGKKNRAILGIKDSNLATEIKKNINGGDNNG